MRRTLARTPGFAARVFTDGEQDVLPAAPGPGRAVRRPLRGQGGRAQGAGRRARGLRLPRHRGGAGRVGGARRWRCTAPPPRWPRSGASPRWHMSLTHTATVAEAVVIAVSS